jgi:hypothetical protein
MFLILNVDLFFKEEWRIINVTVFMGMLRQILPNQNFSNHLRFQLALYPSSIIGKETIPSKF